MTMGLSDESHQNPGSTRKCPFRIELLRERNHLCAYQAVSHTPPRGAEIQTCLIIRFSFGLTCFSHLLNHTHHSSNYAIIFNEYECEPSRLRVCTLAHIRCPRAFYLQPLKTRPDRRKNIHTKHEFCRPCN